MSEQADFDTPWKEILENHFQEFMAFFFKDVHDQIDWSRKPVFLDKELQSITPNAEIGRRLVDKLVKVWRLDGNELWVLIHAEVQGKEEKEFPERVFVYHYRIFDKFRCSIMSLAILTDEREAWRPTSYTHQLWHCGLHFWFPIIKLTDYATQRDMLDGSDNLFAIVVLAHLAVQQTRKDMPTRAELKYQITRRLYMHGFTRQQILGLYRFIDWILRLPKDLDTMVWQQIRDYEEATRMRFITTAERVGIEQGLQQGLQQGRTKALHKMILRQAEKRFGSLNDFIQTRVTTLSEEQLDELVLALLDFDTLADLSAWLHNQPTTDAAA